jgi:gliding motility-associated-like protein
MVTVNQLPNVTASPDTAVCFNDSAQLNATGGTTYLWSPSGSLNDDTINNPWANPDTTTTYIVLVTDGNGCSNTAQVTVVVNPLPIADAGADTALCINDTIQLYASGGTIYSWNPGIALSDTAINNPWANPVSDLTYFITVTDANGCSKTDSIRITVNSLPTAGFNIDLFPSCEGVRGELANTSLDATTYLWDFMDGAISLEDEPEHLFIYDSQLQVLLTATNGVGCSDTSMYTGDASSLDLTKAEIPNVFSPNGDGINDWFEVEVDVEIYECTDLKVYNRWGQLMFESSGNNSTWDGHTFAGEKVPEGVYFYVVNVADNYFKEGPVTLVR